MFQGLKGFKGFNLDSFLDGKIAEEQAKQAQQPKSSSSPAGGRRTPSRAPGTTRRSSARTDSPSKRTNSRLGAKDGGQETPTKGPDPEDFVIGDDASDISRVGTPMPVKEGSDGPILEVTAAAEDGGDVLTTTQDDPLSSGEKGKGKEREKVDEQELPEDVRKKLVKLETLTNRYQDLLRNYRTAHARVADIEPFEATLREHTPLTSITDPGALVEFLNQRSLQSEMVMEELKRLSAENRDVVKERDELKIKLDDAETKAKEAFDEAAGLREQRGSQRTEEADGVAQAEKDETSKMGTSKDDDDFFSYEAEAPRLEQEAQQHKAELQEQQDYINELSTENATLRSDVDARNADLERTRLDLDAMRNKVEIKEREVKGLQADLETTMQILETARQEEEAASASLVQTEAQTFHLQSQLEEERERLKIANRELGEKATSAEENLRKYQEEHEQNIKNGKYVQTEEKRDRIQTGLIKTLQGQVEAAKEARDHAEGQMRDMKLQLNMLESETSSREELLTRLRGNESAMEAWKKKAEGAEHERDASNRLIESKQGHERAAANLRVQLKTAIGERDAAYQMILDCSKCERPVSREGNALLTPATATSRSRQDSEATAQTEASTQPTEVSTASASVDGGEPPASAGGKRNKKKKRSKKQQGILDANDSLPRDLPSGSPAVEQREPTVDDLINDPEKARDRLGNISDQAALDAFVQSKMKGSSDAKLAEIEDLNARLNEAEERVVTLQAEIAQKDAAIERLDEKLKGEEGLQEEVDTLRESLSDLGGGATKTMQDLKEAKDEKDCLQLTFDELEAEYELRKAELSEVREQKYRLQVDVEAKESKLTEAEAENKRLEVAIEELRSYTQGENKRLEAEMEELRASQPDTAAIDAALQPMKEQLLGAEDSMRALQLAKEACEKEIEDLKAHHDANGAELDAKHRWLSDELDALKTRAESLETDLAAANQLAQARFKDNTELKEHLNKVQPELKRLRLESEELRSVKAKLESEEEGVRKLEAKERDLRSEISEYKSQAEKRDVEVAALKEKAKSSEQRSTALEDTYEKARKDLEGSERTRDEAVEAREKLQKDWGKSQEDFKSVKAKLDQLQAQIEKFRDEARVAREELQMKSAQHASAQSLMASMQDQSRELATQMKEVQGRNEGLEEELADAHRLLSERGREGETMRRLLSDVEARADARVREMKERLDLAVEERERAEDEASTVGRRKSREVEELKSKVREVEREAARLKEAREEVDSRERDASRRLKEVEQKVAQAQEEAVESRNAMAQYRDALDAEERQLREVEKERAELRKTLEERETRLEKLQKAGKSTAEELRSLQAKTRGPPTGSVQSARSSLESSSRVMSPGPGRGSNGTPIGGQQQQDGVDYVYLKNVLLQFMEQKEKKHQMQLVPVLGMLLHFDQKDMQKWNAVVAAR